MRKSTERMRVRRSSVENVAGIKRLAWEARGDPAGWHAIIGDNGSGKSSLLRAVALALVGPEQAPGLRLDWDAWLRRGSVTLQLHADPAFDPRAPPKGVAPAGIELRRGPEQVQLGPARAETTAPLWQQRRGWFSAAYGPSAASAGATPRPRGWRARIPASRAT
jgi:hypothetical protein